jgi:hypothetical protein
MPLLKGYVASPPDYRVVGAKNTEILKFKLQLGDNPFKTQLVVVFGDKATKNQDLELGEYLMVNGDWKDNDFGGETKRELVLGFKGNLKTL